MRISMFPRLSTLFIAVPLFTSIAGSLLIAGSFSGCGKYGKPLPPEALGSQAPSEYQILPMEQGVKFVWKASMKDRRGETLKVFDGFKIYRLDDPDQEKIEEFDFDEEFIVSTLPDKHFQDYLVRKKEAETLGKPIRKIKVPSEVRTYTFDDRDVQIGSEYAYFIVPFHDADVRGEVVDAIVLAYAGTQSSFYLYNLTDEEEADAEEQEQGASEVSTEQ